MVSRENIRVEMIAAVYIISIFIHFYKVIVFIHYIYIHRVKFANMGTKVIWRDGLI